MSDESKPGRVSPDPVKYAQSDGRHKLKKVASGTNSSRHQSDTSSTNNSLSKPEPESLPTGLQEKSKDAIASNDKLIVKVDTTTNAVTLNGNYRIFGTKNEDSTRALVSQVANVVLNAEGKHDVQNLKYALATIDGFGAKDELEGLLAVPQRRATRAGIKIVPWPNKHASIN
jgi:hypothetical protein